MPHAPLAIDLQLRQLRLGLDAAASERLAAAETLLAEATSLAYGHGIAEAHLLCAQALWSAMRYRAGLKAVRLAQRQAEQYGALGLLTEIHHTTALLHLACGHLVPAFAAWLQGLELSLNTGQDELGIEALIGIGKLWRLDHQHDRAHDYHLLAYQRGLRLHLPIAAGKAAISLAQERIELGRHQSALEALDEAHNLLANHNDSTWLAEVHTYRSAAWLALQNADAALAECDTAWALIATNPQLAWAQTQTLLQRARVLHTQRRSEDAQTDLTLAHTLAQRFALHDLLADIAETSALVAEAQGQWTRALSEYKAFISYSQQAKLATRNNSDFGSTRFKHLVRNLDQLVDRVLNETPTAVSSKNSAHPSLPRHHWQQQLQLTLQSGKPCGISLIVLPAPQHAHHAKQRLLLLAAFCREHDVLTELAEGLYAVLLRGDTTTAIGPALRNALAALPHETTKADIATVWAEAGTPAHTLLEAAYLTLKQQREAHYESAR